VNTLYVLYLLIFTFPLNWYLIHLCQLIVDANCDQLSRLLHRSRLEVESIQAACQTHIDQQADFKDACDVLKLAKETLTSGANRSFQSTDEHDGSSRPKRKRTK